MRKRKLSLKSQARVRQTRNQLSSLVLYQSIQTTLSKAKYAKSKMEKLLGDARKLEGSNLVRKVTSELYGGASKKFVDTFGMIESVSVYKIGTRSGDGAPMAIVRINSKTTEKVSQSDKKFQSKKDK